MPNFSATINEAAAALRSGDRQKAWQKLHPALSYPNGVDMSDAEFAQSLGMLALILGESLGDAATKALTKARESPTDVQALFNAGFYLLDANMSLPAATALSRANHYQPDNAVVVNTLCSALEANGIYNDAFLALQTAYGSRQQNWLSRYLYVFNAIMSANLIQARQGLSELGEPDESENSVESASAMRDRLVNLLERHREASTVSALDEHDLRGWHYVTTSGLLTHLSPHGIDSGMNGRYGAAHDTDELIHEGVLRALAVLQAWDLRPQQLLYSNDRASEILANVWNQRVGIPVRAFAGDATAPGLLLSYDLANAQPDFLQAAHVQRAGQVVVSHASCWTQQAPFTSDISTFLYQRNVEPWDTSTPAADIARRIVDTAVATEALHDLDDVTRLATMMGAPKSLGLREHFYIGSPVTSQRAA